MNAIELDAIAHDGKITVSIPDAYREQWNEKAVRVILLASDERIPKPKQSLLSSLRQIKISGPTDFSENLDAYLNGEKVSKTRRYRLKIHYASEKIGSNGSPDFRIAKLR
jgi:hypothetical protein